LDRSAEQQRLADDGRRCATAGSAANSSMVVVAPTRIAVSVVVIPFSGSLVMSTSRLGQDPAFEHQIKLVVPPAR
jgi:hypothetical protein